MVLFNSCFHVYNFPLWIGAAVFDGVMDWETSFEKTRQVLAFEYAEHEHAHDVADKPHKIIQNLVFYRNKPKEANHFIHEKYNYQFKRT